MSTQGVSIQAGADSGLDRRLRTPGPHYKWVALTNTTMGVLMVVINGSITIIALPDIFRGIRLNPLAPGNSSYFLWVLMGFLLITSVLVLTFGRLGDMYGRVRMYNLGFAIFTVFSILLSVNWMTGSAGALWIILMRAGQAIGGSLEFANSSAILTDAFPEDQRGLALGINSVAAIAGSFIGLVLGGLLAPVDWRLVFLISVPFGVFGTAWAYLKLVDNGVRVPARIDWLGNITFAVGLTALLTGVVYGIQPYGGHPMGWTNPFVLGMVVGGLALLATFLLGRDQGSEPDVPSPSVQDPFIYGGQRRRLPRGPVSRRPAVHADHLAAGNLAASPRLQLFADPAVGRHLYGSPHHGVPHRRARSPGS